MSKSYRIVMDVCEVDEGKMDAVLHDVRGMWEYNDDYPEPEDRTLRFVGYEDLGLGYPPDLFAEDLARAAWGANGEYCPVVVEVTDEEDLVRDEREFSAADYGRLIDAGEDLAERGVDGPEDGHGAVTVEGRPAGKVVLPDCPDCGAPPGEPHRGDCDVERCSACGGQRVSCDCEADDPPRSIWTGFWPESRCLAPAARGWATAPPGRIVIRMDGGVIEEITGIPAGLEVEIRDYDLDGLDEADLDVDERGDRYYGLTFTPEETA